MPNVKVYDMAGKEVGEITLADSIFGANINKTVMHMAVKNYLANQRQGTQSTLTRSEVSGGGIKPWRQKGTGRARQGSTRAPQWTHGGVALGPKPRDYSYSLTKKTKRVALKSALSSKVAEESIIVVDSISLDAIKTKSIVNMLSALKVSGKAMIVTADADKNVIKSAANIQGIKTAAVNTINTYDLLKYNTLVISKDAVAKIEEVYA